MNYNILTYTLYLFITLVVVFYVGTTLFKNGAPFLNNIFKGDKGIAHAVNKFLLVGFYLINAGYCVIVIEGWQTVNSLQLLLEVLSFKTGTIIFILGIIHFINVLTLAGIGKKRKHLNNLTTK